MNRDLQYDTRGILRITLQQKLNKLLTVLNVRYFLNYVNRNREDHKRDIICSTDSSRPNTAHDKDISVTPSEKEKEIFSNTKRATGYWSRGRSRFRAEEHSGTCRVESVFNHRSARVSRTNGVTSCRKVRLLI